MIKDPNFLRKTSYILIFLYKNNRSDTITKLCKGLKMHNGNVNKNVAKLYRMGVVTKEEENSKREKKLLLTKKGETIAKNLSSIYENLKHYISVLP